MTTIADVARRASVGVGTVSRVLNGSPQVKPATRARVMKAIDELGYVPSRPGSWAPRERGGLVGVLVHFFDGPSCYQRLRGIVTSLQPHGFEVLLDIVDTAERARTRLTELPADRRIDGLIIMSLPLESTEGERLADARFPTVLLDTYHPALPSVTIDDAEGGRMCTRHLVQLGHERIAFVGEPHLNAFGFSCSPKRETGFREVMAAHGLEVPAEYVKHGPHLRASGRQMAMELFALASPPTAIFAASDQHALGVMEAARDTGRQLPRDLSVIGFDDIEMASFVGLSTIRQPLEISGERSASILLDAMQANERARSYEEHLGLELVIRSSSGAAPTTLDGGRLPVSEPARRAS